MNVRTIARALVPVRARGRIRRELRALRVLRRSYLDALGTHYRTDKSSDPRLHGHNYSPLYESHLGRLRREVRAVLEIGVGGTTSVTGYQTTQGGQSLRMWRRYFPKATIVGIDIHHKKVASHRICFEHGDQSDPCFLGQVVARHGPFDLIIDDGSHLASDVRASFEHLWDAVKPGGFYVIEDLAVSYSECYGGGPPGTPGTAAELIKDVVDGTLLPYVCDALPTVAQMHVYKEIVFLQHP